MILSLYTSSLRTDATRMYAAEVLSEEECQQFRVRYRVCGFTVCWNAATAYLVRVPDADEMSAAQSDRLRDLLTHHLPHVSRLQGSARAHPVGPALTGRSEASANTMKCARVGAEDAGDGARVRVYTLDLKHLVCVLAATFGLRVEHSRSYADLSALHWLLEPERSLVEHLAQLVHLFCPQLESKLTCMFYFFAQQYEYLAQLTIISSPFG